MCKNCENTSLPESFQSLLVQPVFTGCCPEWEVTVNSVFISHGQSGWQGWGWGWSEGGCRKRTTLPNPLLLLIKFGSFWGLKIYFCSALIQLPVVPDLRPGFGSHQTWAGTLYQMFPETTAVPSKGSLCSSLRLFLDITTTAVGEKIIIMSWKGGHAPL